jgi:hypothetical protein
MRRRSHERCYQTQKARRPCGVLADAGDACLLEFRKFRYDGNKFKGGDRARITIPSPWFWWNISSFKTKLAGLVVKSTGMKGVVIEGGNKESVP